MRPDEPALTSTDDDLAALGKWLRLAVGVALIGLATAFIADGPWFETREDARQTKDDFNEAWRETGGAIFAGAVISILVLVFEQRREEQRIAREEARSDQLESAALERAKEAATRAWRRDVDIRLVVVVEGEMERELAAIRSSLKRNARRARREIQEAERRPEMEVAEGRQWPSLPAAHAMALQGDYGDYGPRYSRMFREVVDEIDGLLRFLRDDTLQEQWNAWDRAWEATRNLDADLDDLDIEDAAHGEFDIDTLNINGVIAAELEAWSAFSSALNDHIERWYPR